MKRNNGVIGRERIFVEYALARPSASTRQDDFVGRMLWALSHESGLPAKRFADLNPAPPLEWLEAFSEDRYQHGDLTRFGVLPESKEDERLSFSMIRRPAPYGRSPWMALACGPARDSQWDELMSHLARWLVRYLDDPALVIWLAQQGSQLHERWIRLIDHQLERLARLERDGKTAELEEIRANSPKGIPRPAMRVLWRFLLTGRVRPSWRDMRLFRWRKRFQRDGLTASLRIELREILAPKITLREPFRWDGIDDHESEPERLKQLLNWEMVLTADDARSYLCDSANKSFREALPALLDDLQQLLHDALDLLHELGATDDYSDRSCWELPSITPHWQNRGFRDWVALIELLRDAWLAIRDCDSKRATQIALSWFDLRYSTFKRLALFAASQDGCIVPDQWVKWLVSDGAFWLWSLETKRETMRLLVLQGANLSGQVRAVLEAAILEGPPRTMYRDDIEIERWQSLVDHSIWLHLAKLREGGSELGDIASQRFWELSAANPKWRLASNEREEFSHWMSGTGDPDYEDNREIDIAPRKRSDLVKWLKQPQPARRFWQEDTWRETCRTRFFHSLYALCDLAQEGLWPAGRWEEALQVWSEEGMVVRSWRFAAPLIQTMPENILHETVHGFTWWLKAVSKSIDRHEPIFLDLCRRVVGMPRQESADIDYSLNKALNHPVGHVTHALLNLWFKSEPGDNDSLPDDIGLLFTEICNTHVGQFRYGRVLLASRLIALFRVDRPWTERHLLPLFDWGRDPIESKALWEGFLWSPRIYRPLLVVLKTQFLETACHYGELGAHGRQFAVFLTYAGLARISGYTTEDFQTAFVALPHEGLREAARALPQALEGAGEQREDYWKNHASLSGSMYGPSRAILLRMILRSHLHVCASRRGASSPPLSQRSGTGYVILSTRATFCICFMNLTWQVNFLRIH